MKKETTNKLKKAGLVALVASGIVVGGVVYNNNISSTKTKSESDADKTEKEITDYSDLSVEKLEFFIKHLDNFLIETQKVIDSDTLNPEDRYYARIAYNNALEKRKILQRELEKRQNKTINFQDAVKSR